MLRGYFTTSAIDIVGADEERARQLLVDGLRTGRRKPSVRPSFPGNARSSHPPFPAGRHPDSEHRPTYIPNIRKVVTGVEKRRYMKQAFDKIASDFERSLADVSAAEDSIECEFQRRSAVEFTAEIFLHGKSASSCRVWQGGLFSNDGISYAEGRLSGDATNEILTIAEGGELALSAMMGGFYRSEEDIDRKRMNEVQAFQYLWRRFVAPLER